MKFYKYQKLDKNSLINLAIKKNWIADPLLFNDPFEFGIGDIFSLNSSGKLELLDKEKFLIREKYIENINNAGVICYSNSDYNSLLWSHYADHHKGICLVFDVNNEERLKHLRKVEYSNKIFKPVFETDSHKKFEELVKIFTIKSEVWSYEQEYREIFYSKNSHNPYPGKLVEVIFGCRSEIKDIELVKSILTPLENDFVFSKMFVEKSTFNLGKHEIHVANNKEFIIPKYWNDMIS